MEKFSCPVGAGKITAYVTKLIIDKKNKIYIF